MEIVGISELAAPSATTERRLMPRQLARLLMAALAAMGTIAGVGIASEEPAHAASNVSYCFKHYDGLNYMDDHYLQLHYNQRWNTVHYLGKVGNTGCNSMNLSGWYRNHPARVIAYVNVHGFIFYGQTAWAPAGSRSHWLGTGWVNNPRL